jgi:hypothetical protein
MFSQWYAVVGLSLGAAAIVLGLSLTRNYRRCPNIKGPVLASVSGFWLFRATFASRMYLDLAALLKEYGKTQSRYRRRHAHQGGSDTWLVRIAPNKVVTNDPDLWHHMSSPRSAYTRGTWYDSMSLDPKIGNVLACRDEKLHNQLRSKLIRGVSSTVCV